MYMLEKTMLVAGAAVIAALSLFFIILFNTLGGIVVGWVVGLVFSDVLLPIFAAVGIKGFALWQIGAFLGFTGGFFRSVITQKTKED